MPHSALQILLRLGSRGSKLACAQAELVRQALVAKANIQTELVTVKTTGDLLKDKPLADIGGKGLFAKELEEALLSARIDLAVHSMKDLPVELPAGLKIVATPAREDPADALLSHRGKTLDDLPANARIGTGSVRRAAQIARRRPDLEIVPLRGNVDTRIAKLDRGELDAIVLALAGLRRLNLEARATAVLDPEDWLPALAQGALAIEMREGDSNCRTVSQVLDDAPTAIALACERGFQAALGGTCRTPISGHARIENRVLRFRGEVLAPDGSKSEEASCTIRLGSDPHREAAHAGHEAGLAIRSRARAWLEL
ncbi:MAG TPA: hydroxymethylbilane synthase [Rhizomicrobium sp.]|jgi:hydroxymethylbilane synthase|nr:hydroxymethylbilane synthase [Rhizomicrobium sp.]